MSVVILELPRNRCKNQSHFLKSDSHPHTEGRIGLPQIFQTTQLRKLAR